MARVEGREVTCQGHLRQPTVSVYRRTMPNGQPRPFGVERGARVAIPFAARFRYRCVRSRLSGAQASSETRNCRLAARDQPAIGVHQDLMPPWRKRSLGEFATRPAYE